MSRSWWIGELVVLGMIGILPASAASAAPSGQTPRTQPGQSGPVVASAYTVQVTGMVTSVDQQSGKLTLDGPEGEINARFPSAALRHVRRGDTVTVTVGLMEQNPPSASPNTPGQRSEKH